MTLLDNNQVKLIESDVESARITLQNLSDELVDHICCEVENQMKKGKSFDEAYQLIKEQTGIQVLQKIQENTLYLIDKNYALMKTTMKITGNVSLALLGMGTVLKIFHWPGASVALLVGFAILCAIFFPSAVYLNYREFKLKGRLGLNLSLFFGGIAFMAGVLFKVMHWPGANIMLLAGYAVIVLLFLPILLFTKLNEATTEKEKKVFMLGVFALMLFETATMFKVFHWPGASIMMIVGSIMLVSIFLPLYATAKFRETGRITGQFIFIIIISMYAVILTSLLTMNVSRNVLECFVKEESKTAKIISYFEKKNNRLLASLTALPEGERMNVESKIKDITKGAAEVKSLILSIKLDLIQGIDNIDSQAALTSVADLGKIEMKDNYDIVNQRLIGKDNNGMAFSLKKAIDDFRVRSLRITSSNTGLSKNIETLLSTSVRQTEPETISWEEQNFRNNTLISTINFLSAIERNIRMVESETIQHLIRKI